ncbi:MAG: RluA family pseudouridine synthase [Lachnospiraceae bacterium]|nr:RluA family pseudouridine synthase [Lachnospiraceae bacterium]
MINKEGKNVVISIEDEPGLEGQRIDVVLAMLLEGRSRSSLQKLIKEGAVTVNGKTTKPSYAAGSSDIITIELPDPQELMAVPEDIPLSVLYEDEDVLVINKPKGMVVHPAPGHMSGTVVNAVLFHCSGQLSGINGVLRPGIVHRIDMDTTGSLIICKNDESHQSLAKQLEEHSIDRTYRAIVWGDLKEDEGVIDAPMGRDKKDRKKMAVIQGGKRAVTGYRVLERLGRLTYIECRLETGRTHQIRVHMSHIGHPILGDKVYGKRCEAAKELREAGIKTVPAGFDGQCLHAQRLGFTHPVTDKRIETSAPLPDYFIKLLEELGSTMCE